MPYIDDPLPKSMHSIPKAVIFKNTPVSSESERLVESAIKKHIAGMPCEPCLNGEDNPFFVADLGQVIRQYEWWQQELRDVLPFYAVKCNNDRVLLKLLADLGTGFDCASIEELRQVLAMGVNTSRIIFANPCKSLASLAFASKAGVRKTTFDNLNELDKIKAYMPNAQLLLRIYANDDNALISFAKKFGAPVETTDALLSRARELQLDIVGVSFHVGTGAADPRALELALRNSKEALVKARQHGFQANVLDVGGGFQDSNFTIMSSIIRRVVKLEFPLGTKVIAEPGRFMCRTAFILATKVIARRHHPSQSINSEMIYQNDGVYGNFMNVIIEKEEMFPVLIPPLSHPAVFSRLRKPLEHNYSVWGPTCDSTDCVSHNATFPSEILVGDWLKYKHMGAYTNSTSTQFNGFTNQHETIYVCSEAKLPTATKRVEVENPKLRRRNSSDIEVPRTWLGAVCSRAKSILWRGA